MALDNNRSRNLMSAVTQVAINQSQPKVDLQESNEVAPSPELEAIVFEYLSSVLGNDFINESTEQDTEEAILEAVQSLNIVCSAINQYFGLTD
jgi:hypothetical protein